MFDLLLEGELEKMLEALTNCGRWSETMAVRFSERESGPRILENML